MKDNSTPLGFSFRTDKVADEGVLTEFLDATKDWTPTYLLSHILNKWATDRALRSITDSAQTLNEFFIENERQDKITKNRRIAEFMGVIAIETRADAVDEVYMSDGEVVVLDEHTYDSWDELMPVVQRCYDFAHTKMTFEEIRTSLPDFDKTYAAVVAFVEVHHWDSSRPRVSKVARMIGASIDDVLAVLKTEGVGLTCGVNTKLSSAQYALVLKRFNYAS
jgi:hypothetical protein